MTHDPAQPGERQSESEPKTPTDQHCPICSATLVQEKCKVVCRSPQCVYRIIFNCSEF